MPDVSKYVSQCYMLFLVALVLTAAIVPCGWCCIYPGRSPAGPLVVFKSLHSITLIFTDFYRRPAGPLSMSESVQCMSSLARVSRYNVAAICATQS
jgi:hypothetical protein